MAKNCGKRFRFKGSLSKHASGGSRISPRRGRQLSGGRQDKILLKFPENSEKENSAGGGASPAPPLDPPLHTHEGKCSSVTSAPMRLVMNVIYVAMNGSIA